MLEMKNIRNGKQVTWNYKCKMWETRNVRNMNSDKCLKWEMWEVGNVRNGKCEKWEIWEMLNEKCFI